MNDDAMNDDALNDGAELRDAEKNWHDPVVFREAAVFVVSVVALAAVAFAATVAWHSLLAGILVPVTLVVGGLVAFFRAYQLWRSGGVWPIWQGAGWILIVLFLLSLQVPVAVA